MESSWHSDIKEWTFATQFEESNALMNFIVGNQTHISRCIIMFMQQSQVFFCTIIYAIMVESHIQNNVESH